MKRLLTGFVILVCNQFASAQVNSAAEATNKAEHEAVHNLAHVEVPVIISGRTSTLNVAPDSDCVVEAELVHDSDFRCRKLIYGETSKVTTDPTKSFTVLTETRIQLSGGNYRDICPNPEVTHNWVSLPRTCNCGPDCPCKDTPCRCHDPVDLGGGFIYMGQTEIRGAEKSTDVQPEKLTRIGCTTDQIGWRNGDWVCVPAMIPGEANEIVQIIIGGSREETVKTPVPLDTLWPFPTETKSAIFTLVDGSLVVSYQKRVEGDPRSITFNPPLKADHVGAPVLNLTRNIVHESEEVAANWQRGHVMGMHAPASDWSYYEVRNMGRTRAEVPITKIKLNPDGTVLSADHTNPVGRYSDHCHWRTGGNSTPSRRVGAVYRGILKWGAVNHGGNMIFDRCIAIGGINSGAGFSSENGLDHGVFSQSTSVGFKGPIGHTLTAPPDEPRPAIGDLGWQGNGFWLQGGGMSVEGCKAYDCNEGVGGYARALSEVSDRSFDPKWLRDGALKTWAMTDWGGKLIGNAWVPFLVKDSLTVNCQRAIGFKYREGGASEPTLILRWTAKACDRGLETHYMFAGLTVQESNIQANYGSKFFPNTGRNFRWLDNKINASVWGLDDPGNGDSVYTKNVFLGKGSPDIRLRSTASTINDKPCGPEAISAVKTGNSRDDGTLITVEAK